MPSNHSQQAVVFSTYMILKDLEKNTLSPLKTIIYVLLALIIMYSRIYLNCHTIQQVIMGGVIGLITTLIGWIYTR
jgi:membrane-associated phospholipid phosphatase